MILIGTASWTDPSLIKTKRFYPPGCTSAEARLRYYASQFPLVEVDSSYYAMPSASNSHLWVERTPEDFTFNVKAFRALTQHQTPIKAFPRSIADELPKGKANLYARDLVAEVVDELWHQFREGVRPLAEAGKLGALHFQFPPWFTAKQESYDYLEEVRDRLSRFTVAIEFRHKSWFMPERREAMLAFLRQHRFVNVTVDEPQGAANTVPQVWDVTNDDLALVRVHGRNEATWNIKGATAASDRFNYDYNEEELAELAVPIERAAKQARTTHVVFNNNYEDQGVRNAKTLMLIMRAGRDQ